MSSGGISVIGVDTDAAGHAYGVIVERMGIQFHFIKLWDRQRGAYRLIEKGRWRYSQQCSRADMYLDGDVYRSIRKKAAGILFSRRSAPQRVPDQRQGTLF